MPSAPSTYNEVINRLQRFAAGHFNLRSFTHGQVDLTDNTKFPQFPWMHAIPITVNYAPGARVFTFEILFMDLPRDKEDKAWNQSEALSDTARIAEDLINEITNGHTLFGADVLVSGQPVINLGIQEFTHVLTGSRLSVSIEVPNTWDACDIPASWTLGENGETGGPGDGPLLFQKSIIKADGIVTLVNDVLAPGNSLYYGTNGAGVKGWYVLTGGGGGVATVTGSVVDNTDPINPVINADAAGAAAAAQAFAIQRSNHTGTQDASTITGTKTASFISDFAATVLATVLTGLSLATSTAVAATDTILVAIGKLQAQITALTTRVSTLESAFVDQYKRLGGDTPSNSTNVVAISGSEITLLPNAIYIIEAVFKAGCNGTGGFGFGMNYTSGIITDWALEGNTTGAAVQSAVNGPPPASGSTSATAYVAENNANRALNVSMIATTGAGGGTVEFIFQGKVGVQTSTIYDSGSYIKYRRIS